MGEAWFTAVAEELSRCVVDARECADVCERFLESQREVEKRTLDALVAPAAVARVLIDLIDEPPQLVLAAARLCRDSAGAALAELAALDAAVDAAGVQRALETMRESCDALLDAVD